jgi:hypothetical protein
MTDEHKAPATCCKTEPDGRTTPQAGAPTHTQLNHDGNQSCLGSFTCNLATTSKTPQGGGDGQTQSDAPTARHNQPASIQQHGMLSITIRRQRCQHQLSALTRTKHKSCRRAVWWL